MAINGKKSFLGSAEYFCIMGPPRLRYIPRLRGYCSRPSPVDSQLAALGRTELLKIFLSTMWYDFTPTGQRGKWHEKYSVRLIFTFCLNRDTLVLALFLSLYFNKNRNEVRICFVFQNVILPCGANNAHGDADIATRWCRAGPFYILIFII